MCQDIGECGERGGYIQEKGKKEKKHCIRRRNNGIEGEGASPCPEPMGLRLSPAAGPPPRACSSAPPCEGPSAHPASGRRKGYEKKVKLNDVGKERKSTERNKYSKLRKR